MEEFAWLGVVRHGQSVGNLAADRAEATAGHFVEVDQPDSEVPLTALGEQQAVAVGHWLAQLPDQELPTVVLSSPYRRARQTAELALAQLGQPLRLGIDERLRDRELGILDRLTSVGVAARLPQEHQRRQFLGKFYYRPPGGESWADVALRLRSLLAELRREHPQGRILLFAHQAVVVLLRYLVEELEVARLLDIAGRPLANAALTSWHRDGERLALVGFDDETLVTRHADPTRQPHV